MYILQWSLTNEFYCEKTGVFPFWVSVALELCCPISHVVIEHLKLASLN